MPALLVLRSEMVDGLPMYNSKMATILECKLYGYKKRNGKIKANFFILNFCRSLEYC